MPLKMKNELFLLMLHRDVEKPKNGRTELPLVIFIIKTYLSSHLLMDTHFRLLKNSYLQEKFT